MNRPTLAINRSEHGIWVECVDCPAAEPYGHNTLVANGPISDTEAALAWRRHAAEEHHHTPGDAR